ARGLTVLHLVWHMRTPHKIKEADGATRRAARAAGREERGGRRDGGSGGGPDDGGCGVERATGNRVPAEPAERPAERSDTLIERPADRLAERSGADGAHAAGQSDMEGKAPGAAGRGLQIARRFTAPDEAATRAGRNRIDPIDRQTWERRSAVISGEGGDVVFEQNDVEVPAAWSQLATNVVASKYFRGPLGTPQRETSVKQLVGRVVSSIRRWGEEQGYFATPADAEAFADELTDLLVNQKASFNSPVWFNVGVEPKP